MIHVLIDTCTLIQLNKTNGFNKYLIDLENLVNSKKILVISHHLTVQEWEKNKEKERKRKERTLLFNAKENELETIPNNSLPSKLVHNTDHFDLQNQLIKKILDNAIVLSTPDIISREFAERFRKRLAPFHKKRDSQNDWEIIGSACIYCEDRNIKQLYFVSDNHTDFADPDDIYNKIHPAIQERFNKVHINYFKDYSTFFSDIDDTQFLHQQLTLSFETNKKYTLNQLLKALI